MFPLDFIYVVTATALTVKKWFVTLYMSQGRQGSRLIHLGMVSPSLLINIPGLIWVLHSIAMHWWIHLGDLMSGDDHHWYDVIRAWIFITKHTPVTRGGRWKQAEGQKRRRKQGQQADALARRQEISAGKTCCPRLQVEVLSLCFVSISIWVIFFLII